MRSKREKDRSGTAKIRVRFYAELGDFLPLKCRGREFEHSHPAGGSVKDLIEGLGVPHTQVDLVLVNGEPVSFAHRLKDGDRVSVYPVFEALDISKVTAVRPQPLRVVRFAVDVHLGRLASYLRLAGFDTLYRNDWDDAELAETAVREQRIVLTRDRGLLMRSVITHGHLVREIRPRAQLWEVLDRFDLWGSVRPFSRCSLCNGLTKQVAKAEVQPAIPTKAAACHQEFWRCESCGQVYWRGSHFQYLANLLSPGDDLRHGAESGTAEQGYAQQAQEAHSCDT